MHVPIIMLPVMHMCHGRSHNFVAHALDTVMSLPAHVNGGYVKSHIYSHTTQIFCSKKK